MTRKNKPAGIFWSDAFFSPLNYFEILIQKIKDLEMPENRHLFFNLPLEKR
jgi:hypothetical protein